MYDNFDIVSIIRKDPWCYPFRMNKGTETKGPSPCLCPMFVPCFIEQVDRNKRTVPMFEAALYFRGNVRKYTIFEGKRWIWVKQ